MKNLFALTFGLLSGLLTLTFLTVFVLTLKNSGINITYLTPIAISCGALVALLTLLWNVLSKSSEEALNEALKFFEKSYDTLNVLDENGWPLNERMRWLTAARLLSTAVKLSDEISLKGHKTIYRHNREYWRQKFRDLILPTSEGFPKEYFAAHIDHFFFHSSRDREPISISSILVLYRFIQWPDGEPDPLDSEKELTSNEVEQMRRVGPRQLSLLLRDYLSKKED